MCHELVTSTVKAHIKKNHFKKQDEEINKQITNLFKFNSELLYDLPDKIEVETGYMCNTCRYLAAEEKNMKHHCRSKHIDVEYEKCLLQILPYIKIVAIHLMKQPNSLFKNNFIFSF